MEQRRVLKGASGAGQFAATTHGESSVALSAPAPTEHELARPVSLAIYVAGRGFGRNRFGNPDRIQEAQEAANAYVDGLGEPRNSHEAEARDVFAELRDNYEADKDSLEDKDRRTRQFEAARQANWIIEYRTDSYNNRLHGKQP